MAKGYRYWSKRLRDSSKDKSKKSKIRKLKKSKV